MKILLLVIISMIGMIILPIFNYEIAAGISGVIFISTGIYVAYRNKKEMKL